MVTKFRWSPEKNIRLQNQRGISFEMIVAILETGKFEVLKHPTRPSQKIATFIFKGYPWDVPFVEQDDGSIFLKDSPSKQKKKMKKVRKYQDPKIFEPMDEEEAQIMAESDKYVSISNKESKRIKKEFQTAAKNTLKKTARTNIRISEADLEGLKLIAAQKGIGYQTLISGILHQVASGQLQV